jgi:2-polyprenyl-6-methoxyphenol hydroxylase-like FAD-dependent oxidoreductase
MTEILIVGAGPTGLTAAVELARRGFALRIVERDPTPTALSKAVGVAPHSLDLLEACGVTERLLARGVRMRGFQAHRRGRLLGAVEMSRLKHRFNFLLCLPQSATETAMAEVLQELGVAVEWNTQLTGLRPDGARTRVTLQGPGGTAEAGFDMVLGADGIHSRVREALGLAFEGITHNRTWSIADGEVDDWPHDPHYGQLFLGEGGDVGIVVPIGEHAFRSVSNTPDALAAVGPEYRQARVRGTDTFRIPARQASRYRVGGVFLGGDAAHAHSPVGARGMNLGIEDAVCFARRLAEGSLDGYEAERRPVETRWIAVSERILAAAQATGPAGLARDLAMSLIFRLPALQQLGIRRVAGLDE